jgi:hypothetical protein
MPKKKRRAAGRASGKAPTRDMSARKNPRGSASGVPGAPGLPAGSVPGGPSVQAGSLPGGLLAGGVPGIRKPSDF